MKSQMTANYGIICLLIVFTASSSALAAIRLSPEDLAKVAVSEWLPSVDYGRYAESWERASSAFQTAVSKEEWEKMLHVSRDPLGKALSRTLKSATYTKTLPGAPDGEYVIVQYYTTFEHKKSAVETITPTLDKDDKWRVSGYYIR